MAYSSAAFGAGSGNIFLTNVGCNGGESDLLDCTYSVGSSCSHTEDVGVRCQGIIIIGLYNYSVHNYIGLFIQLTLLVVCVHTVLFN